MLTVDRYAEAILIATENSRRKRHGLFSQAIAQHSCKRVCSSATSEVRGALPGSAPTCTQTSSNEASGEDGPPYNNAMVFGAVRLADRSMHTKILSMCSDMEVVIGQPDYEDDRVRQCFKV